MNDKKIKNGGKGTNVGNALRWLAKSGKKIAPHLLNMALDAVNLDELKIEIEKDKTIDPIDKELLFKHIEMDYKDIADARDMQKVALQQEDKFSKRFVYYLAIGVFVFSASVVILLFFVEIPKENRDVVNFILGVVVGTGLTGIFQYFFGSSKGSKDKSNFIYRIESKK